MTPSDFEEFCEFLRTRTGVVIGPDKKYLLESRLLPVIRQWGMESLEEVMPVLRSGANAAFTENILDAMMTNESSFFRDTHPFEQFKNHVLPTLLESRKLTKKLRIWSSAASSGQEAFSLAMILDEMKSSLYGWNIEIVGTDISTAMIKRCEEGLYTQFEVQRGLPVTHLVKYFEQVGNKWKVKNDLRKYVSFRTFNLLKPLSPLGTFDVIFCRNVLIYFDRPMQGEILGKLAGQMPEDGFLFLGGAETVFGVTDEFVPLKEHKGLYGKTDYVNGTKEKPEVKLASV